VPAGLGCRVWDDSGKQKSTFTHSAVTSPGSVPLCLHEGASEPLMGLWPQLVQLRLVFSSTGLLQSAEGLPLGSRAPRCAILMMCLNQKALSRKPPYFRVCFASMFGLSQ